MASIGLVWAGCSTGDTGSGSGITTGGSAGEGPGGASSSTGGQSGSTGGAGSSGAAQGGSGGGTGGANSGGQSGSAAGASGSGVGTAAGSNNRSDAAAPDAMSMAVGDGSAEASGVVVNSGMLPGDIAASAGTPLVAAHSVTRALTAAYSGKLFQARRKSDGKTQDIGTASQGGLVDLTGMNTFCSGTTCSMAILYDQTGNGNDLPQTIVERQPTIQLFALINGAQLPMAVSNGKQYVRNRTKTSKIPKGAESQTEYFVVNGKIYNDKCCYDYGNMESGVRNDGAGTTNALYFGSDTFYGAGAGKGPWGKVDMENGVFAGAQHTNNNNPSTNQNLVTVLSKTNGTSSWALKVGDPETGSLNTYWNGALPSGYSPLKQQGGLSLGEGGDGSNAGIGAFFEGVIIAAVTSDATDVAIQGNIKGVYGK